jgi:hypothetical protein
MKTKENPIIDGKEQPQDVIFRAVKTGQFKGDIDAFFPDIPETPGQPHKTILSYTHVGQHGAASIEYYRDNTRPATEEEYADLFKELTDIIGYKLRVINRITPKHRRAREAADRAMRG